MDFTDIEAVGKNALECFPLVKRSAKRVYQLVSVATNLDKGIVEGNITRVSPNDAYEYFYGYYDKSPWDATDRYMICIRVKQAYKSVAPKEPGIVCVIDTQEGNTIIEIGTTHSWNVQQGCMAQWMGPDFHRRIIYNDFRDGHYCSIIYNFENMAEEKVLPLPVYDISRDGTFALSLDFNRLHRMRPGYGYSNQPDNTKGDLCPDKTCIWKISIKTGKIERLFRYTDFAKFEPDETMKGAEHKINHLMISPNGKRFMVLHRWIYKGRKHTRLVTVNIDKTDMYNLSDDVFVSHCFWKNDEEILSFLRKKETGDHYYLMKDKTQEYKMFWPRLRMDGHCSYSPNGSLVITDSYPNRKRMAYVYVCAEYQEQPVRIAKVFSPFKYDNDCRCDLHPRWNRKGNEICIDSVHEGKRGLYVISITENDIPPVPAPKPQLIKGEYKIVYVITQCKNSGPMKQTLNIIKNLDRSVFQPIVIMLFQEDLGNSVIQKYLDVVPEFYCLNMSKVESVISGKKKLAELLDIIKPSLIHGLGMPPYTLSLGYEDAVHLVTLRNYCYEDYPDKYGKQLGIALAYKDIALIKKQTEKGEIFVTCSESLSKIYDKKLGMKFDFIRNGVDIEKYEYADPVTKHRMKQKLGLPEHKIILMLSGQFIDRKNQEFAINAVLDSTHSDQIHMVLMGGGPNLQRMKEKYGNNENIQFTGNITNVNEYLQAGDIYVSASKSEGMPNGVLEAMASGLPVLLSDIPQHLEVLELSGRYGFVYEENNQDEFLKRLDSLLESDLSLMGKEASKTANEKFSAKNMSAQYQKLYKRLIQTKS